jgi:hypothetical protein
MSVAMTVAGLVLASCGSEGDRPGTAATSSLPVTPTSAVVVPLPDGFPVAFPPPPDATPITSTSVIEAALMSGDRTTQHGTVVHRSVRYEYGSGRPSEFQKLLRHYRTALPAAGWTITQDQRRDPDDRSPETRPSHQISTDGHGLTDVRLTITPDEQATTIAVGTTELDLARTPYYTYPPSIEMPGWYSALPEPPEGTRRYQIKVTNSVTDGQTYEIGYEDHHEPTPDDMDGRAAALISHYRSNTPARGWTLHDLQDRTERPGTYGGVVIVRHVSLGIQGHQVTGTIEANQTTSQAGQWLSARLTITIGNSHSTPGGINER